MGRNDRGDGETPALWRADRGRVEAALNGPDGERAKRRSHTFLTAAVEGAVTEVSDGFVAFTHRVLREYEPRRRDAPERGLRTEDAVVTNLVGGVAGVLIESDQATNDRLYDPGLIRHLASHVRDGPPAVSRNAMIAVAVAVRAYDDAPLSLVIKTARQTLPDERVGDDAFPERTPNERIKGVYAGMALATVSEDNPWRLAEYFNDFRNALRFATDGRLITTLGYCMGRVLAQEHPPKDRNPAATREALETLIGFAETGDNPRRRSVAIESLIPFCLVRPDVVPVDRVNETLARLADEDVPDEVADATERLRGIVNKAYREGDTAESSDIAVGKLLRRFFDDRVDVQGLIRDGVDTLNIYDIDIEDSERIMNGTIDSQMG